MDKLAEYRAEIDAIDERLIELLGRRYTVCRDVARFKKEKRIPMMQSGRVEQVKERCARLAERHGVDPGFVRELYAVIIGEACRIEDQIIESAD